jgi:hypothetical protein
VVNLFFRIQYKGEEHDLAYVSWFVRDGIDPETNLWRLRPEMLRQGDGSYLQRCDVVNVGAIVMAVDIVQLFGSENEQAPGGFDVSVWNRFADYKEWDAWFELSKAEKRIKNLEIHHLFPQ